MPESDLSFDFTVALENQLRSLLCACFPNTPVKPKSCAILSGIIKPSLLSKDYKRSLLDNMTRSTSQSLQVWILRCCATQLLFIRKILDLTGSYVDGWSASNFMVRVCPGFKYLPSVVVFHLRKPVTLTLYFSEIAYKESPLRTVY